MLKTETDKFYALLKATLEVYGQLPPTETATGLWWNALARFDLADVRKAFDEHIRTGKFSPRPADLLEILGRSKPDGRPTADEAWAMIPRDEYTSAMMTDEMHRALHTAQPLLDEGDQVAARMAFKAAYDRLVGENKRAGIAAKWNVSLGWDAAGREPVLAEALRLGRIGTDEVIKQLPPERVSHVLELAGLCNAALEYKSVNSEKGREAMVLVKEMLARKMTAPTK